MKQLKKRNSLLGLIALFVLMLSLQQCSKDETVLEEQTVEQAVEQTDTSVTARLANSTMDGIFRYTIQFEACVSPSQRAQIRNTYVSGLLETAFIHGDYEIWYLVPCEKSTNPQYSGLKSHFTLS